MKEMSASKHCWIEYILPPVCGPLAERKKKKQNKKTQLALLGGRIYAKQCQVQNFKGLSHTFILDIKRGGGEKKKKLCVKMHNSNQSFFKREIC